VINLHALTKKAAPKTVNMGNLGYALENEDEYEDDEDYNGCFSDYFHSNTNNNTATEEHAPLPEEEGTSRI
jgi:hypothetical protein